MPKPAAKSTLERYRWLIEISRDLASTLDLDVLLNRIVRAAADLTNAAEASILLYDQKNGELFFQTATNAPVMRGLRVPVNNSLAGWIVTNREPIIIRDVQEDKRYFKSIAEVTNITTTSLLGVPMITKDKVVGVIEAINKLDGDFTPEDQETLMTLGAQAAVAIENSCLFQQSDLISEFVHEIRTPLSSIITASQILLHPHLEKERHDKLVSVIQSEATRLAEMATSFLDLSRLESGRSQFHLEPIHVVELLEDCATLMEPDARANGLAFSRDYPSDLPPLQGDYDKLKQAVLNLLNNAIKYNRPNGKVILRAFVDGQDLVIEVEDTGIGIPKEHAHRLFEKFFRVPGTERLYPGTGLGLSVVKRIIEGHQGEVSFTSEPGVGTTFTCRLPL